MSAPSGLSAERAQPRPDRKPIQAPLPLFSTNTESSTGEDAWMGFHKKEWPRGLHPRLQRVR
nr:MAG TPA: hypothetical protein [Caudoviricetes sp.]